SVSVTEGNAGTTTAVFTVSLSAAYTQPVTVRYATADGSATAGVDYQAAFGTLTFAPGETSKTVTVAVYGDRALEYDESFSVNRSDPTNAFRGNGRGVGTIRDDEPRLSIGDVTMKEGNSGTTAFAFTVSLAAAYDEPVSVDFVTEDGYTDWWYAYDC